MKCSSCRCRRKRRRTELYGERRVRGDRSDRCEPNPSSAELRRFSDCFPTGRSRAVRRMQPVRQSRHRRVGLSLSRPSMIRWPTCYAPHAHGSRHSMSPSVGDVAMLRCCDSICVSRRGAVGFANHYCPRRELLTVDLLITLVLFSTAIPPVVVAHPRPPTEYGKGGKSSHGIRGG